MSKILAAMRKASPGAEQMRYRLETLGAPHIFPPPGDNQLREFEQLANTLISAAEGNRGSVIVFAATVPGEGTSFVSYNVARHASLLLDRPVAWVDANFRNPQAAAELTGPSFRALLKDPALFAQLHIGANLVLIPNGEEPIKATDLLCSENYVRLLEEFQRNFYLTIFDGPPILESVEAPHLAQATAGLVLVVESRRLKHEVIRHGIDLVSEKGVRVLGTVLNKRTFVIPGRLYERL